MDPPIRRAAAVILAVLLTVLPTTLARAAVPTVAAFSPVSGPVGTMVTIFGTGFTGGVAVNFNGISSSSFAFLSDTQAQATVPPGATTGRISVVTPAGTALSLANFTVTTSGPTLVDCAANPTALQPAIDAVSSGATLYVSGTCVGTFTVSKDLALIGKPATLDAQGLGTPLIVSSGSVKVVGLTFTGGTGSAPGGGIFNNGTLMIERSVVSGNISMNGFGGIGNNGTLTIERSLVSENTSTNGFGGGIYNSGTLTITKSVVSGNTATLGGGIINYGSFTITNSRLSNNKATNGAGGGIVNFDSLTIMRSSMSANSATSGGAIYNGGALSITYSKLSGNMATNGPGGGVYSAFGTLTIARSVLSGNSALSGGAILTIGGSASVTDSTVSGNSAAFNGGGIYNESGFDQAGLHTGSLTLAASTLNDNSASDPNGGGGGIYNGSAPGSTVSITNSTLNRNSATYGGGIINVGSLAMTSTTVRGNTAMSGGGIYNGNAEDIVGSSIFSASINAGNVGGDCSGPGPFTSNGYNLVGVDCAFSSVGDRTVAHTWQPIGIGPLAYNGGPTRTMAVFYKSPAKDAIPLGALDAEGLTSLCLSSGATDQRYVRRPQGPACDIGSFERRAWTWSLEA